MAANFTIGHTYNGRRDIYARLGQSEIVTHQARLSSFLFTGHGTQLRPISRFRVDFGGQGLLNIFLKLQQSEREWREVF